MGTKELNLAEPISKKIYKSYEDENIRVGICLMQGWRKTMEDTALAMPNFDGQENSLFGIFDGHGGSIVSQFVACNIENILKNSKYYKKANYEKSLVDSFILLDELLKNKSVDTFLKKIRSHQKDLNDNMGENAGSIINKELFNNNIKNDPFADYLFFCSSYLDNETNLKYQFPNLDRYLKRQYLIGPNISMNEIKKINLENKKRYPSTHRSLNNNLMSKSKSSNLAKFRLINNLKKKSIMEAEDINMSSSKNFSKIKLAQNTDKIQLNNLFSNDIGTTANVLLLKNNYFYVANVGDSLSVMYKKEKAIKLNQEHKTTLDKEYNRIKKCGGKLINYRINGKLNITRAIGDLSYKNRNNGLIYEQDVLAIPEVMKYSLDDVDFIVMGSDGFWDYGDDIQTICDNIYKDIKNNPKKDLCDLIGNIFDKGLAKSNNYLRGTDNMSCIIIQFIK